MIDRRLFLGLLLGWVLWLGGVAQAGEAASDQGRVEQICRDWRQERDALAARAMEEELALVRFYRSKICPQLAGVAEGANARDQRFAPLDYAAWSRCRQQAEQHVEARHSVRYRNSQTFTFYTAEGAALARKADHLLASLKARGCL